MTSQHGRSGSTVAGSHSISLKVLRLSRPTLATQIPLPHTSFGHGLDIAPQAALAYPSARQDSGFPLTPLLTLPNSFGSAYVGESFACTLCVNNELGAGGSNYDINKANKTTINGIRINANLQTPNNQAGAALEVSTYQGVGLPEESQLQAGETLQLVVRHDLKENGPHVLAVTVTYNETAYDDAGVAIDGRVRTFRKLYQFVAQQLIVVRSKITEMKRRSKDSIRRWVIEAQLENVGESSVALEKVDLKAREGVVDCHASDQSSAVAITLKPQDIEQMMFIVQEEKPESTDVVRRRLAQLNVHWRSAMGEPGSLSTGWLTSKE